ncbi:MAG: hypothetical protein EBV65_07395 [Gammaproteobacteria bacterium]|nr:hypothetical protein [Gammaproteobacteria bacterium]NDF85331.1 hypothetical protein [Gammaproteobacteria bacterium]
MRIERVVGSSFNEASERSRKLYGLGVRLISSARVGDIHELLVCTDVSDADDDEDTAMRAPSAGVDFAETLRDEVAANAFSKRTPRATVEAVSAVGSKQQAGEGASADQGAALVGIIRRELQALEMRLSANGKSPVLTGEKMALLEQGVSSAYAESLLAEGADIRAICERLIADLSFGMGQRAFGSRPALLIGPAAGGRTTVAMQAAHLVAAAKELPAVVSAVRDLRPGAREKFFAIADAAKVVSNWGGVADGSLVIDGGAYSSEDLQSPPKEFADYDVCLCIPAYLNRRAASAWLNCAVPLAGVIVTHWSDTEVPLGLIAALAERQLPLIGMSASADPNIPLTLADSTNVMQALHRIMSLALADGEARHE